MRQRLKKWIEQALTVFVLANLLVGDAQAHGSFDARLDRIVGADRFNFVGWEIEALAEKSAQAAVPIQAYLDDRQRAQFVVDYLDQLRRLNAVAREIDRLYSDPDVGDPEAASVDRRAERDRLRAEIERRRPTAEAIIQDQVAGVLADEGLAIGGRAFPPVLARVTPLPNILILSPRDQIKREPGVTLSARLTVDRADAIEAGVFSQLDKSALVTGIGGLAVYPSMIFETPDLLWLLQVVSHEWTHHWLFARPLGLELLLTEVGGSEALTINETVSSIAGDEIGRLVLKRFYPDIARRDYPFVYDPPKPVENPDAPPPDPEPGAFNFNREMHRTRVQVDGYLAEAHALNVKAEEAEDAGGTDEAKSLRVQASEWIVKAETYMEERRKVFIDHGYWIRKLNQAYFAFHGSYADQPGASGRDPIGPAVRELRARIPEIADFLNAVAPVRSLDDLKRVLAQYP